MTINNYFLNGYKRFIGITIKIMMVFLFTMRMGIDRFQIGFVPLAEYFNKVEY
jgi:hypothetical protein